MADFRSAVWATQDALLVALQARPELAAYELDFGMPSAPEPQHVWIEERIADATQETAATGRAARDESFTLHVVVYVKLWSSTATEVRDELRAAGGVIEEVLGTDPTLGGALLDAQVAGFEYDHAFGDQEGRARIGAMRIAVSCRAWLTA